MTLPPSPCGTLSEVSRTSRAFSLKMARISFSSRGQLGLALRRHLADEQVAGADLGADADDAAVVEVRERLLRAVRDVARDLLVAELRRAGVDLVLVDVDRAEHVVLDEPLAEARSRPRSCSPRTVMNATIRFAPSASSPPSVGRAVGEHLPAP
jgi:hypothetical protein